MVCKKCGNEIVENDSFCTKCGTPITNSPEENNKETNKKSIIQKLKKLSTKVKVLVIFLILIIISIVVIACCNLNNSSKNVSNNSSNITNEETNQTIQEDDVSSSKYTKEQVMTILTSQKSSNEAPMIIQLGELRLNELKYVDSTAYLYRYNFKIVNDDTINFYIVVPEQSNSYGMTFYDIWSYQASYTITDRLIQCFNEDDFSNVSVEDTFKINKEYTVSHSSYVQSSVLSSYLSQALSSASGILNYNPNSSNTDNKIEQDTSIKKDNEIEQDTSTEKNNGNSDTSTNSNNSTTNSNISTSNNEQTTTSQPKPENTVKNITMPNLVGLTRTQAENKLNELGIPFTIEKTNSLSKDTVFSQSVAAGTSKPINEYGTITIKTYEKVSAIVRVIVKNTDSSKKYELVGKPVKVVLNGQVNEDSYFNGESTSRNFLDITTPNITVQVYIDNELVKTQEFNIEDLVQKSEYYTDVTINI